MYNPSASSLLQLTAVLPAVSATRKILNLMGCSDVPVQKALCAVSALPRLYRRDSFIVDHLPILNQSETIRTPLVPQTGQDFMVRVLREAPEPGD